MKICSSDSKKGRRIVVAEIESLFSSQILENTVSLVTKCLHGSTDKDEIEGKLNRLEVRLCFSPFKTRSNSLSLSLLLHSYPAIESNPEAQKMTTLFLPQITIQHDFPLVLSEILSGENAVEDIWISLYQISPPLPPTSLHAHCRLSEIPGSSTNVELTPRDGIAVEFISGRELRISCPTFSIKSVPTLFPLSKVYQSTTGIECFALDSQGEQIVVGGKNGKLVLLPVRGGGGRELSLRGFVADITAVQFFPSNQVVLAASADLSLRIFSALVRPFFTHWRGADEWE